MATELVPVGRPVNAGDLAQLDHTTTDERLVEMWATWPRRANSPHSTSQYRRIGLRFLAAIGKPLQAITAADLKAWTEGLDGAPATRRATINAVRSLFSFSLRMGYLRANPAVMIAPPPAKDTKHQRILTQAEALLLIMHAPQGRDQTFVRCLYSSGARISELCALTWGDVEPTKEGAVLHIMGKGGKQRAVAISKDTYTALLGLRGEAAGSDSVFGLSRVTGHRIVKRAAAAAGITKPVSAHWFRHSHASHSIANGANVVTVQRQLGHASLSTTTGYVHSDDSSSRYLPV